MNDTFDGVQRVSCSGIVDHLHGVWIAPGDHDRQTKENQFPAESSHESLTVTLWDFGTFDE